MRRSHRLLDRLLIRLVNEMSPAAVHALQSRVLDHDARQRLLPNGVARPPLEMLRMDPSSYSEPRILQFSGDTASVAIGRYCSVSEEAEVFLGGGHDYRRVSTAPLRWRLGMEADPQPDHDPTRGSITVGNDVYIGWKATLLAGVAIGDGAFIAARAVVTRDVEPYAIVGGNPAQVLRYRFDEPTRAALLRIRWWEWPPERIRSEVDILLSHDVAGFVAAHDPLVADAQDADAQDAGEPGS